MLSCEELLSRQLVQCTRAMRDVVERMHKWRTQAFGDQPGQVLLNTQDIASAELELRAARSDAVDMDSPAYDEIAAADEIDRLEAKLKATEDALAVMTRAHQELNASVQRRILEGSEAERNGFQNRIKELEVALAQQKAINMGDINKQLETECRESNRGSRGCATGCSAGQTIG